MHDIVINNLSMSYTKDCILRDLTTQLPGGKITTIIGPNGSGKSTLLKTIAKILKPNSGEVLVQNRCHKTYQKKEFAKILAFLAQTQEAPSEITIRDLVSYGRYAYQSLFKPHSIEDKKIIDWALHVTNLSDLQNHPFSELSGGQQQRTWIAMALTQNSKYLLLDEPTTYLDIKYQLEILNLLQTLNKTEDKTIIMVLHDINHAIRYSDNIVVMQNGQISANSSVENLLKTDILNDVFGIKFDVLYDRRALPILLPAIEQE